MAPSPILAHTVLCLLGDGVQRQPCGPGGGSGWRSRKTSTQHVPARAARVAGVLCRGLLAAGAAARSAKSFDFHESERVTQKHPASRERRMEARR